MEREDELDDKVQAAAEEMEAEIEELEKRSDEVGEDIEATEAEWKRKQADPGVPGAEPVEDDDAADEAGQ